MLGAPGALLDGPDAGPGAPMRRAGARTHLHKDQSAVLIPQDQVDFAAAAPGRPIIPGHQPKPGAFQVGQSPGFRCIAALLRAGLTFEEFH